MNRHSIAKRISTVVLAGIACLVLSPSLNLKADQDSAQVSDLLSQAKMEAIRLREDANQMQNFVLNEVTWDTHAVYATMIVQDIAAMREKVDQLDKARSSGADWQKTVIDQINPLMNELASTTERVVETMDQEPFDKAQYNDYLEANYDHATHLAALISASVDYRKTKIRLQRDADKLDSIQKVK